MSNVSKTKLLVISGSSGVGKGTVIKSLLEKCPDLNLSVSCTTRGMRSGEVHGVNYFYLTREEFQAGIDNDEFLEWAEFSGNFYGTRKYAPNVIGKKKNKKNKLLKTILMYFLIIILF